MTAFYQRFSGHCNVIILFAAVWIFIMRRMSGGSGGGRAARYLIFGKSKATCLIRSAGFRNFNDVAGLEEAKQEVMEIVDFSQS